MDAIVVNRDGGGALFRALASLERQEGVALSLVVVDNASDPAEREKIGREAPAARVIGFSRNLGFAGGANEGIARTRSPFVLLLNNDAALEQDYVARLAARLELDGRLAGAQGLVLAHDGRRVDSAGFEWNGRGEAVPVLHGADAGAVPREPFEVPGISATAALYRREALESVARGGSVFDDAFFAYYEDVDLSLRLARAGWRFVCDPRAVGRHEGSRTGRRTPFRRALWTARNRWRALFRNFEPRLLARRLPALLAADVAHALAAAPGGLLLPLLVWPRLPWIAWKAAGEPKRLDAWPGRPPVCQGAENRGEAESRTARRPEARKDS